MCSRSVFSCTFQSTTDGRFRVGGKCSTVLKQRDRGNRQFSIACSQVCPPKIKRERSLTRCSFRSAVYGMVVPTVACHAIMAIALQSQFNSFTGFPQAWQRSVKQALHVKRKAVSRSGLSYCLPGRPGQEFRHDGKARMDHAASRHKSLHRA